MIRGRGGGRRNQPEGARRNFADMVRKASSNRAAGRCKLAQTSVERHQPSRFIAPVGSGSEPLGPLPCTVFLPQRRELAPGNVLQQLPEQPRCLYEGLALLWVTFRRSSGQGKHRQPSFLGGLFHRRVFSFGNGPLRHPPSRLTTGR